MSTTITNRQESDESTGRDKTWGDAIRATITTGCFKLSDLPVYGENGPSRDTQRRVLRAMEQDGWLARETKRAATWCLGPTGVLFLNVSTKQIKTARRTIGDDPYTKEQTTSYTFRDAVWTTVLKQLAGNGGIKASDIKANLPKSPDNATINKRHTIRRVCLAMEETGWVARKTDRAATWYLGPVAELCLDVDTETVVNARNERTGDP